MPTAKGVLMSFSKILMNITLIPPFLSGALFLLFKNRTQAIRKCPGKLLTVRFPFFDTTKRYDK